MLNSAQYYQARRRNLRAKTDDVVSFEVPFVVSDRAEVTKLLIEKQGQVQPDGVAVRAIARAWVWFEQLTDGKAQSMAEIAARENITDNYVSNLIHLAWLSPRQVDRVLDGEPMATDLARKALNSRQASTLRRPVSAGQTAAKSDQLAS